MNWIVSFFFVNYCLLIKSLFSSAWLFVTLMLWYIDSVSSSVIDTGCSFVVLDSWSLGVLVLHLSDSRTLDSVSYTHLDVYKRQREYSTNQGCMQKIIWFCLNLRQLSFAIEKKSTDRHTDTQTDKHTDTFRIMTFFMFWV